MARVIGCRRVAAERGHDVTLFEKKDAIGGQITTYVNMISGPRKPGELDGPEEVHLVLLDNGRSQAFADTAGP